MKRFLLIWILLLTAAQAIAGEAVNPKTYLGIKGRQTAIASIENVQSDPGSYVGSVFEVRGLLIGVANQGEFTSLIVKLDSGGSLVVQVKGLFTDSPGVRIACIVQVGPQSLCSLTDLTMVCWSYASDLLRIESALRPAHEPTPTRETREPTSPNALSRKGASSSTLLDVEKLVSTYSGAIKGFNKKLSNTQVDTIARSILGFSNKYKVDPRLVCAVILAESSFRIEATSHCGALGLGQLMPNTAASLGISNPYDPVANVYGSIRCIRGMLDRMSGNKTWDELTWNDLALGLAAYNAGPGAVKKHGGIPPYKETRNYVSKVTSIYKKLCGVK
jgi:hypothetical protein